MGKANAERGEHEIVLAGTTYRLRPSHEAMKLIEADTGLACLALVRLGNRGELTYTQLGIIGAALIRAGADDGDTMTKAVSADGIEELLYEEGMVLAQSRFTLCLLDAGTGGRKVSGEAKAAPATA